MGNANILIKNFFLNKNENEISFILKKYKSKSEIFIEKTDDIVILNSENSQNFSKKKFLHKEIIDLNLEKKYTSKGIYFINFFQGKVFSTLSPKFFSEKDLDFIKKIKSDFDSKDFPYLMIKENLLVAFDRENNNILARAFYENLNSFNTIYIHNLSLNSSINIGKGIGKNLLEAFLNINPNIKLNSVEGATGFYEKFLKKKEFNRFTSEKSSLLKNKKKYFFIELNI